MKSSITEHPYGALSIPASGPEERSARARQDLARIAALDPEQPPLALAFLAGYYPAVLETVLEAVEPCDGPGAEDDTPDREPFCMKCGVAGRRLPGARQGIPALPWRPHRGQQA